MEIAARQERDCGMVVVGNEILSGKVHDTNSYFAARELRKIGVALRRIAVVPDELQPIADEVINCAGGFEIRHHFGRSPVQLMMDLTMAAVALAFGGPIVMHYKLEDAVRLTLLNERLATGLKMAEVPEGAVLNAAGDLRFPTVQFENVWLLRVFRKSLRPSWWPCWAGLLPILITFGRSYPAQVKAPVPDLSMPVFQDLPSNLFGSYPRIGDPGSRVS